MKDKQLTCERCDTAYFRLVASRPLGYFAPKRTFKTEQGLANHLRIHDELYCPICCKYQGVPDYICNSHFIR